MLQARRGENQAEVQLYMKQNAAVCFQITEHY